MSRWNHVLCVECYEIEEPERVPHLLADRPASATCCRCGAGTEPIYYRAEPTRYDCKGDHGDDE